MEQTLRPGIIHRHAALATVSYHGSAITHKERPEALPGRSDPATAGQTAKPQRLHELTLGSALRGALDISTSIMEEGTQPGCSREEHA